MKKNTICGFLAALAFLLGLSAPVMAQGSVPIAMQTVVDQNGKPIVGALLYFYQVGTVATRQDSFQDTGLANVNQWPLPSDAYGRLPMFYLASGSVHVRLTDATGLQLFDYPSMLVIGPSGGGGGGGTVDPTTIAATGDVKFRPSAEVLTGWIRCNGNTIGSATSGATERANADTQNLFVYLWNTFGGLTVSGGRGASALADFTANKTITTVDMRGFAPHGLDTMGAAAANRLVGALFGPPYNGSSSQQGSTGGEATHTLTVAQLPTTPVPLSVNAFTPTTLSTSFAGNAGAVTSSDTTVAHWNGSSLVQGGPGPGNAPNSSFVTISAPTINNFTPTGTVTVTMNSVTPTGTVTLGSGTPMNTMDPFILGTFFMKL